MAGRKQKKIKTEIVDFDKPGLLTVEDVRKGLLQVAGVTKEELGAVVRKSLDKLVDKLDAKDSTTFQHLGTAGDTVYKDDNSTQLKAAEALLKFTDTMPKGVQGQQTKTPHVTLNLPGIYTKEFLEKTQQDPITIEVEAQ